MSDVSEEEPQHSSPGPLFWVMMAVVGSAAGTIYGRWTDGVWSSTWALSWTLGIFIGWLIFRLFYLLKERLTS